MKNILLLLCICMMACTVQNSFGAFAVKPVAVNHPAVITTGENATTAGHKTSIVSRLREKLHALPSHIYGVHNVRGIYGTLALVAGILSFIPLYGILFGAAAIVLGTIGIHRHQKLAFLGLVLGCTGIAANLVYLTVLIVQSLTGFGVIAVF